MRAEKGDPVMRERTTWKREEIAKRASEAKQADDPRAMNQDHHSQQPSDTEYVTGGPSEFAEDVHPSGGTWKAEEAGGETKRNEIGMPQFRGDTFNHPEKTAKKSEDDDDVPDEETVLKKANLTTKVARHILGSDAAEEDIEAQSLALMDMPDQSLIEMANRLAGVTAAKKAEDDEDDKDEDDDKAESKDDDKDDDGDGKPKKGEVPPQFQKKDDKKASTIALDAMWACAQSGDKAGFEQAAIDAGYGSGTAQDLEPEAIAMDPPEEAATMVEAIPPSIGTDPAPEASTYAQDDEAMLDQMLTDELAEPGVDPGMVMANEADIEMGGSSMDMSEVQLTEQDGVLQQLFNDSPEVQQAQQALGVQANRNQATRTVGTQPTEGVAKIGTGMSKEASAGGGKDEVSELQGLWTSAPDVSNVFR